MADIQGATNNEMLCLARLMRVSGEVGLSAETRSMIGDTLESLLDDESDRVVGASFVPKSPTAPVVVTRPDEADWEQCGLMIRHLVQADASWAVLNPWVRRLMALRPHSAVAANAVELAFLAGTGAEIEALVEELRARRVDFWFDVRPEVRSPLLVGLWRERRVECVAQRIFEARDDARLTAVERLLVYYSLQRASDPSAPFLYYGRHEKAIHDAIRRFGAQLGLSPNRFLIAVARVALDAGDHDAARRVAERVPAEAAERDEALRLLLDIATDKGFQTREGCVQQILEEKDGARRVDMMRGLLAKTRELGGVRDRSRPAVNHLLASVNQWLAPRPDTWRSWSRAVVEFRDLERLLPDLFETFVTNALVFHTPDMDRAIWDAASEMPADGTPRERYWKGVGTLHRYMASSSFDEALLWEARDLIMTAAAMAPIPVPHDWSKIHAATGRALAKCPRIVEKEREAIQVVLRVAAPPADVTLEHVEAYLERNRAPSSAVMAILEDFCRRDRRNARFERAIIDCRSRERRYSNAELGRAWNIACGSESFDEAWRAASILHARVALHPALVPAWEVSGEKRREYVFTTVTDVDARVCLYDFAPDMARFCGALMVVGPALTELIAVLDPRHVARRVSWTSRGLETDVTKAMDRAGWIASDRRRYRFGLDADAPDGHLRPPFAQSLPSNTWSFVVAEIAERMGLFAWRWNAPYLASLIEEMIPGIRDKHDVVGRPGKIARWMRGLSPTERAAWNDTQRLARSMDETPVAEALAVFVARLATLTYQNHFQALTSIHAMRAPLAVTRGLERWIMSPEYGKLRARLGTRVVMPVPLELRQVNPVGPIVE